MKPTLLERAERIRACVLDVMDHGVNLLENGDRALWGFVQQYRDYFHEMLGYQPSDKEIVHLIRRVSPISPVDSAYMVLAEMRTELAEREEPPGRLSLRTRMEAGTPPSMSLMPPSPAHSHGAAKREPRPGNGRRRRRQPVTSSRRRDRRLAVAANAFPMLVNLIDAALIDALSNFPPMV
jgi:hypothetical protein